MDNKADVRFQGWDSPAYEGLPEGFGVHSGAAGTDRMDPQIKTAPAADVDASAVLPGPDHRPSLVGSDF